jgi:uncharacterized protein YdhG (YjbR/CyaY superfamily)
MPTQTKPKTTGLSDFEKAAARERVKELKAEAKRGEDRAAGLKDLQAKIAEMNEPDRSLAQQIHALVTKSAPQLDAKTWYGMPAWVNGEGKLVCWFKPSAKFKDRYSSFGFEQAAQLDDGNFWPSCFAITRLTAADEAKLAQVIKKAAG